MLQPRLSNFVAVAGLLATTATAQLEWQQWLGAAFPPARHESAMSFDPAGGGLLLFGGSSNVGELADTWRFDGSTWQQLFPANAPDPRYGPRLATDTTRDVVVLFGGLEFDWFGPVLYVGLGDTWEWDGTNWTQRFPQNSPPGRYGHAMAYDKERQVTVLCGGTDSTQHFGDTWEWDGVDWVQVSAATPMGVQYNHSMAYDDAREVVVLADGDGASNRGTWEWDGSNWAYGGTCPTGRGARLVYDEARERVAWYGGADNNGNALPIGVLEWDGATWTPRATVVAPPDRFWHMIAYDPGKRHVVVFGGRDDNQPSLQQRKDDTWLLTPEFPATVATFGVGCAGSNGVPAIDTADLPWLGTTLQMDWENAPANSIVMLAFGWSRLLWAGATLPLPLATIGMPGCELLVSLEHTEAAVTGASPVQQNVFLPNVAAALGQELHLQGFALDVAANALGVTASNGLTLGLGGL